MHDKDVFYQGTQNLYVRQDPGYEGTENYEPINPGESKLVQRGIICILHNANSGYRLAQPGRVWPGGDLNTPPDVDTELDCWALCRQEPSCLGFVYGWKQTLEFKGSCTLKGTLTQNPNDFRAGGAFVNRYKGGQNVYIDKGSLCPGGYINIHTYITPSRLNDDSSYAGTFNHTLI